MKGHKIVQPSKRGQLVLPKEFRQYLHIDENTNLSLRLLPDGAIEIRPVDIMPISYLLENEPELREKVVQSIEGEFLDEDASREFLFDNNNL